MKSPSKQVMDGRMVVSSQVYLKTIVNIITTGVVLHQYYYWRA